MAEPETARWWGSMRVRTTLAATLVVAAALAVGALVLVTQVRNSLETNLRAAAMSRAGDIAALAASGRLPTVLDLPNQDATFAQVVGFGGRVVAASANIAGEPAVGPLRRGTRPVAYTVQGPAVGQDGRYGLVALPAHHRGRPVTVYTGYSLTTTDLAVGDVAVGLLAGLPLLLLLVAMTSWWIVGRAVRPIDRIRSEVATITTEDLHRRVPVPPSGDELARLARTMNGMLDRLEVAVDRQREFVADASHELRSPLTTLRTQLEVGLAAGTRTDWPTTVQGALMEEERLVADLLLLARIDAPPTLRPAPAGRGGATKPCDLAAVVRADAASRQGTPPVVLRADGPPALVDVDEHLARRVVANLVDNARRHAETAVSVEVTIDARRMVVLVVADDGPGVPAEQRERVFERFTRLDDARSDAGGAGLGLAIVRAVVGLHGGTVGFTDAPRGARVEVRLPLAGSAPFPAPARVR
ncbi:MAG: HAMP domain-containing sensor histidine kinase [Streptosporangiaceae bacterium]